MYCILHHTKVSFHICSWLCQSSFYFSLQEIGIVSPALIEKLLRSVDYINLMTYDFPSETITGVAPLQWIEANLRYFLDIAQAHDIDPSKLLLGLNWYNV